MLRYQHITDLTKGFMGNSDVVSENSSWGGTGDSAKVGKVVKIHMVSGQGTYHC